MPGKSDEIRKYIQKHPKATQADIVAAMKAKGVEISPSLAGTLLRKSRGIIRPRKAAAKQPEPHVNGVLVTMEQLKAAKAAADSMGGLDKLQSALDELRAVQVSR